MPVPSPPSHPQGATVLPGPRDGLPTGLRGLNNLGNSCFMSSVLHAMLHAPLLRLYYLSGGHPRELCARRKQGLPCLSCELDRVVGEMYSGQRAPYSPVALLHAWWRHADHLAGYQQQDAHEFYLTTLCAMDGAPPLPSSAGTIGHDPFMENKSL